MAKVHVSAENAAVPLSAPSVTSRWSQPDNGNADWRGGRYRSTEGRKKKQIGEMMKIRKRPWRGMERKKERKV